MKKTLALPLLALILGTQIACGGALEYKVPSSAQAPGADAHIVADVNEDQSTTQLEIKVEHLAPPDRVNTAATAYVIWQRSSSSVVWSRVGALLYDADARSGTFQGSVPEAAFDLTVTAEKTANVASPSANVVFSQRVAK